jgi:hypothetical protein
MSGGDGKSLSEQCPKDQKRKRDTSESSKAISSIVQVTIVSSPCECERATKIPKITVKIEEPQKPLVEEFVTCEDCGRCPCLAIVEETLIATAGGRNNKAKRFELYSCFSRILKYKRKTKLPPCIVEAIKDMWPDEEGKYVGFK